MLRLRHIRTRPYTPKTNGKAERFIQTLLREWAYALPYRSSQTRAADLPRWLRHYNHERPHASLARQSPTAWLQAHAEQPPRKPHLVLAFGFGFAARRLHLPPLVGYLLAGIAIGPFMPGFVADISLAGQLAEVRRHPAHVWDRSAPFDQGSPRGLPYSRARRPQRVPADLHPLRSLI